MQKLMSHSEYFHPFSGISFGKAIVSQPTLVEIFYDSE